MKRPTCKQEGDRYLYLWYEYGIGVGVERLREASDGLHGEISIHAVDEAGLKDGHLHWAKLNLSSTSTRNTLSKFLKSRLSDVPNLDCDALVEWVCVLTQEQFRTPAAIVDLASVEPSALELYAVSPIVTLHETNILYGDGGSGKSLLALAMALSVVSDFTLPSPIHARLRGPVLYLDYETCQDEQTVRLHSLALGGDLYPLPSIHYRPAFRSVADEISTLRADVQKLGVQLVIVDSMGPACGGEPEKAEVVLQFMNALRSLGPVTRLVISHVSKGDLDKRRSRIFGSVYARNLSRSCWEVRAAEEEGTDSLSLGLYHEKFNRGKRHKPIGLKLTWQDKKLLLSSESVLEHPELSQSASLGDRIRALLKSGPQTAEDLAESLEANRASIRQALHRMRGLVRLDGNDGRGGRGKQTMWSLLAPSN